MMLICVVHGVNTVAGDRKGVDTISIMGTLIIAEAVVAVLCTSYLLFAGAGVVRRSTSTCYPIPAEVESRLKEGLNLDGMKNVPGPSGSRSRGTYCVRCLVWRPPKEDGKVHHCQVCQRCVRGFDHHCGVFGRCIVRGNMPCFFTLIAMMFAGMGTTMVAVTASVGSEPG